MTLWLRRFVENGWVWRGPALVAAAILSVTSVVALVQRQEAERRRELVFQAQADQLRQEILEVIDRQGERFRTAVDFVAVTHPGPLEQFRAYFDRRDGAVVDEPQSSYDFILIEGVVAADFDALRDREHALGNVGFQVRSLTEDDGERLVVTRTAGTALDSELDLTGLDVTGFQTQLPVAVPDQGYSLRVLEPGPSMQVLLTMTGQPDDVIADGMEQISTIAMLVSPVSGLGSAGDGSPSSYATAVRLIPIAELLDPVDRRAAQDLQATLLIDGIDEPMAVLTGPDGPPRGAVDLDSRYDLITDGQRWQLVIAADATFGPSTGLFDSVGTWIFGVTTATLAAATLLARNWSGRRLVRTEQELASALTVASTDGLTGLLNRVGFVQRSTDLDVAEPAAMIFIDLDGFKAVNDLDGHEAGDRVLQAVAEALRRSTRPSDLVSRLGGDEFIIYLPGLSDPEQAEQLASRLIDAIDDVDERLSCSIGVSLRRIGEVAPVDELLRRADAAMYKVKRSGGRGYHLVEAGFLEADDLAPVSLGSGGRADPRKSSGLLK